MTWVDSRPWFPILAPLRGTVTSRTPTLLSKVVAQFDVTRAIRYQPTATDTYCNVFVWDVTRALDCEIPHWVDKGNKPAKPGTKELTVNATCDWLATEGMNEGWLPIAEAEARLRVKAGYPTVAIWKNPAGHGHIAMVVPPRPDAVDATFIAQAGRTNFAYGLLSLGFGPRSVTFYSHA